MTTKDQDICISCKMCCKYLSVQWGKRMLSKASRELYTVRGCLLVEDENYVYVLIPTDCPQLSSKGCIAYDTRPRLCRKYDGRTDPAFKDICLLPKEEL